MSRFGPGMEERSIFFPKVGHLLRLFRIPRVIGAFFKLIKIISIYFFLFPIKKKYKRRFFKLVLRLIAKGKIILAL